jgi:uncharacterized coiled-coil protein SlyX
MENVLCNESLTARIEQLEESLRRYHRLHDGLSEMVEDERLLEADIPDDYQWLVESLEQCAAKNIDLPGEDLG